MWFIDLKPAVLTAHPSTPNDAVRSLGVQLRAEELDMLVFQYSLDADMLRVRVPPSGVGGRADALWKHTCFEAFVAPADASGYYEFNFSPSLDWAIYRFSAYRQEMSPAKVGQAPKISVRQGGDRLELQSAVIEDENGRLSYWGLRHPPGKPDFHQPNGFVLEVARS